MAFGDGQQDDIMKRMRATAPMPMPMGVQSSGLPPVSGGGGFGGFMLPKVTEGEKPSSVGEKPSMPSKAASGLLQQRKEYKDDAGNQVDSF